MSLLSSKLSFFAAMVPLLLVVGCDWNWSATDTNANQNATNTQTTPQENPSVAIPTAEAPAVADSSYLTPVETPISTDMSVAAELVSAIEASRKATPLPESVEGCFEAWHGPYGFYRIETGFDNGQDNYGYWFAYADDADGGLSKIVWPMPLGNEYSDAAFDNVIEACGGVCGTYTLGMGALTYEPFIGLGFTIAGADESGEAVPVDASKLGGVQVTYFSSEPMTIEMGFSSAEEAEHGYDLPFVSLPKTTTVTTKKFKWSEFDQSGWGPKKISGPEGAKMLATLKFRVQGRDGLKGSFNIISVGPYDPTCTSAPPADPVMETPSSSVVPSSSESDIDVVPSKIMCENFENWYASEAYYDGSQVRTGCEGGSNPGAWFEYADSVDGGQSYINWDLSTDPAEDENFFDAVLKECRTGICGIYRLDKGTLSYDPFVGIGFNLGGVDAKDNLILVDATSMGGICIQYTSDAPVVMEMGLGDEMDAALGYAVPAVDLPRASNVVTRTYTWSQFRQPSWGRVKISSEEAVKAIGAIKFRIQGKNRSSGEFNIRAIGAYNNGSCELKYEK